MQIRIHNHLTNRVALNYNILRIKQKLGYSSFLKNQTWTELWLRQILKSYQVLSESGQIKKIERHQLEKTIVDCVDGDNVKGLFHSLIKLNI